MLYTQYFDRNIIKVDTKQMVSCANIELHINDPIIIILMIAKRL